MKRFTRSSSLRSGLRIAGAIVAIIAAPAAAQAQSAAGHGTAAAVSTPAFTQQFASATLPSPDGFASNSVDVAAAPTLSASALNTITSGMADAGTQSSQTSAEAGNVSILSGLITARQVTAIASSYANGSSAASDGSGSTLLGLVVNGVSLGDALPAPNTRIDRPGTGYVVLNEQTVTGDGSSASGITVNMIHVVLLGALGNRTGEIVVGSATSQVGS